MQYELVAINRKTAISKSVETGSMGILSPMMDVKQSMDKEHAYAIYTESGVLQRSTYSGGANPHAWDTRASNKSRKRSGLNSYNRLFN